MTENDRRKRIEAMLRDDPSDSFLRYSLAMECRKASEFAESLEILRGLMNQSPPHVPSFLMAAQILVETNEVTEARTALRTGIEQARLQDEQHAAAEMSELLATLGELGE